MYITLQNVKFINSGLFLLGLEKWQVQYIYWDSKSYLFFSFGAFDFVLAGLEGSGVYGACTVAWTDYRFYSSKLFFPEALTRKSKTIAYLEHLL